MTVSHSQVPCFRPLCLFRISVASLPMFRSSSILSLSLFPPLFSMFFLLLSLPLRAPNSLILCRSRSCRHIPFSFRLVPVSFSGIFVSSLSLSLSHLVSFLSLFLSIDPTLYSLPCSPFKNLEFCLFTTLPFTKLE